MFGGGAVLCDGCAIQIAQLVEGARSPNATMPGGALIIKAWEYDDSGPDSPTRRTGESYGEHHVRHYCRECKPVALDRLKEAFARLPLVDHLSERE